MRSNPSQDQGLPRSFLGIAVEGPSREGFLFYPAYRLRKGGAGHGVDRGAPHIHPDGRAHSWSLDYAPKAAGGRGRITVKLDGKAVTLELRDGERGADTRFDRFGIVTTWIDGNGQQIYFDDLAYTSKQD